MLEDIEKYIGDVVGFKVENIFYLFIYKPRIIEKHRKVIKGRWKGPQRFIFKLIKNIKKDTWVLKILMF
jgi:hypothetical protein